MTVSWTDDGNGRLAGSLQSTTPATDGNGDVVNTVNASFTGTLHDGQISIVTHGALGDTSTLPGGLSGETLTLNIPQPDGSISRATFVRGQVSEYNAAVTGFRHQVTQERAQAASDAANAAAQAASDAANAATQAASDATTAANAGLLSDADTQVSDGVATLRSSLSDGLSFDSFSTGMTTLNNDLRTTRSDAAKATAEGRSNTSACGDANGAQGDAAGVGGDESAIGGDQSEAQFTIDSVSQKIDSLRKTQEAMKTAYQQQGLTPSASDAPIVQHLRQADATTKTWKAKVADYVSTAHALASQATDIADAAAKAVC